MNKGKYVFAQLISFCSHNEFIKCVDRYNGNKNVRKFRCWHQFLCLVFGHLTNRESLRDIVICLQSQGHRLYHLGFPKSISRSTFSDANQNRNWRIYADFAQILMKEAKELYSPKTETSSNLRYAAYALDASLIRLCISVFRWANYRKTKAAIKLHTMIDIRTELPEFLLITDGKVGDMKALPKVPFQPFCFYILDRGYLDLIQLYRVHTEKAWFVVRARKDLNFKRQYSIPHKDQPLILCDQIGVFVVHTSKKRYPAKLRCIKSKDPKTGKRITLLTNNFELKACEIADLYRQRWRIELFFKWIKQHLRIKIFWGENENAVKIQIWTAMTTYLLLAIAKRRMDIPQKLNEIQQILSVSVFDKVPLDQLLSKSGLQTQRPKDSNQLKIF